MNSKEKKIVSKAINLLAIALTDTGHTWSSDERSAYNEAHKIVELIDEDFKEVRENA